MYHYRVLPFFTAYKSNDSTRGGIEMGIVYILYRLPTRGRIGMGIVYILSIPILIDTIWCKKI